MITLTGLFLVPAIVKSDESNRSQSIFLWLTGMIPTASSPNLPAIVYMNFAATVTYKHRDVESHVRMAT